MIALIRLTNGREMVYPAGAVKVDSKGRLYVALSILVCTHCELLEIVEAE